VLVARGEKPRVLGVLMESEIFPARAPDGHVLLRMIYGGSRDAQAVGLPDEALGKIIEEDLATLFGVRSPPTLRLIVRPGEGIPQPRPGHVARVAEARARAARHGLGLVGGAWSGVSLNDIVRGARSQ
jgi:oxygen-dependent protoporphyrinogen oxidase